MMRFAKTAALSVLIGLGTLAAIPAQANPGPIQFDKAHAAMTVQWRGGDRWDRWRRAVCTPGQAVHKAQRMGVRNARVVNSNRKVIRVAGHSWRDGRTAIVFAREPHCPVIR
jgi:hypothetical protein